MKNITRAVSLATLSLSLLMAGASGVEAGRPQPGVKKKAAPAAKAAAAPVGFNVFTEAKHPGNHFVPSGWMGDISDISFSDAETVRPRAGRSCIKMGYKAQGGAGWAGIFWQNPANNWGTKQGAGFDLSQYKKLTFWARGDKGGEVMTEVKVGGIKGEFPDSAEISQRNLILSDQWTQYTIDLEGSDLSHIIGGFCVVFAKDTNPAGAVVYLDDIIYTK
jgi:hypothetical protein